VLKRLASQDQAAVDKVLAGDTSAFEHVVRRWQGSLVNLAYRFCRDRGRAEEIAQEAFLRAYRSLARWRRAAFSTWLFALATNLYCCKLRRAPVRTLGLDDIVDERAGDLPALLVLFLAGPSNFDDSGPSLPLDFYRF
jgi:RNA polymerase sigma-70 factor (ECF subfamily)